MSGDAQITGRIHIDPPITWPELRGNDWAVRPDYQARHWPDAVVDVNESEESTDDGVVIRRTGVAIKPTEDETSARTLTDDVTRIARQFGTAPDGTPRTFTGFLHVVWARGEHIYRVIVRDGAAVEVEPQVVWPAGARDEDGAP